jgi:hypothetical protein
LPLGRLFSGPEQVNVADSEGSSQLENRHYRRIALPLLQATEILLAEARNLGELFLSQPSFLPHPPDVLSDQPAHVHVQRSANYTPEVYQL